MKNILLAALASFVLSHLSAQEKSPTYPAVEGNAAYLDTIWVQGTSSGVLLSRSQKWLLENFDQKKSRPEQNRYAFVRPVFLGNKNTTFLVELQPELQVEEGYVVVRLENFRLKNQLWRRPIERFITDEKAWKPNGKPHYRNHEFRTKTIGHVEYLIDDLRRRLRGG